MMIQVKHHQIKHRRHEFYLETKKEEKNQKKIGPPEEDDSDDDEQESEEDVKSSEEEDVRSSEEEDAKSWEEDEIEDDEQESEEDEIDDDIHSFISDSRPKLSRVAPPPITPRRSRQNSASSTQSSVRYASLNLLPPTAPVRRRRVVESILLRVQRKEKTFERFINVLKRTESPTMYDLGLEFLRVYDGKFNYREGHKFVMPYRKKTWFLTIEQIKCVDCPVGDIGPRSVLILNYKNNYSTVHV